MKNITVSIIIVNYKVKEKLLECISSIYESKPKTSFEIVVVDNDEAETIEKELKVRFPKIRYIKSEKNLGYGGGNNLGAKNARGEYLFILNPDTFVYKNTIDELARYLIDNKDVGIASPLMIDKDKKPFTLQGTSELTPLKGIICLSFIEKLFPDNPFSRKYWLKDWDHRTDKQVEVCPGTAFMISRKLFEKIEGFDEKFFLYFEEDDVSKRTRKLGYKIYILAGAKIFHEVGASTKQLNNSGKIFSKSRFLYFRKHFGFLNALFVELFLNINKTSISILLLFILALSLRVYNLSNGMTFIGDQGWFYLSARDLLVSGKVPLVGITSSHTWLHQGPLWTYMLSLVLPFFKFNPVAGGYLTAFFGAATAILMYKVGKELFSAKVGGIAALLYATSPLIVFFDRMPFDPSPIPFFTVLYLYALVKWLKGNVNYFPLALFLIAILYNLELATFTLFFPLALLFIYGFIKKRKYSVGIFNKRIVLYSLTSVIAPMMPVIIYDFSNGFKQTIVFLGWTLYKPFSFLFNHSSGNLAVNLKTVAGFGLLNLQKLIFQENLIMSLILFIGGFMLLIYLVLKNRKLEEARLILLFLLAISLAGIIINQTPSDAYLPIIFPFIIFSNAILFEFLLKMKFSKYVSVLLLLLILLLNSYSILKNDLTTELKDRTNAADKIIKLTNNQEFNLIGKGAGSQFRSFTMNYEYLLWWKGYPVSENTVKTKIVVWETQKGIIISKKE